MALREHLRADEDAGLRRRVRRAAIPAHRAVACCRDRRAARGTSGKRFDEAFFQALGAHALRLQARGRRNPGTPSAPVAARRSDGTAGDARRHAPSSDAVRRAAALALRAPAAVVAQQHRRVTAAVAEHEHLPAGVDGRARSSRATPSTGPHRAARLRMSSTRTLGGFASPARCDRRRCVIAPGLRVVQRFQRRRRAAEHHRHAERLAAHQREVARVVADAVLLLVAAVVFFVDDDQARFAAAA